MSGSIRREMFFPHAPADVRRALTDWPMPNDFEPRVGHRFTFRTQPMSQFGFDGVVRCKVLECAPPSRLAYSWVGGRLDSRVSYRLEVEAGGTRVFFEHAGFDLSEPSNANEYRAMGQGWANMDADLERVIAARREAGQPRKSELKERRT